MPSPKYSHWLIAILIGSLINVSFFLFLPVLGRTSVPEPPLVIELDFLTLQPSFDEKNPEKKKVEKKYVEKKKSPPPKIEAIAKKKNQPVVKKELVKPTPVLSEMVIPDEKKTIPKPPEEINEVKKPEKPKKQEKPVNLSQSVNKPINKPTVSAPAGVVLPIPTPVFKLTSLARMIHRQTPVYPAEMKAQGKEATVKLKVLIDAKGKVRQITIKKSAGSEFDQSAIDAIRKSTFKPAKIKERAVSVIMVIPVKFRLR